MNALVLVPVWLKCFVYAIYLLYHLSDTSLKLKLHRHCGLPCNEETSRVW